MFSKKSRIRPRHRAAPDSILQCSTTVRTGQNIPNHLPRAHDLAREIPDLVASGHNNQEIAEKLFLSLKTVHNYVSNIFTKLQVADRAQAIVRAGARHVGRMRYRRRGTSS